MTWSPARPTSADPVQAAARAQLSCSVLLPIRGHEPCRDPAWLWKPNVGNSYALSHAGKRALVGHVAQGGFLFPILSFQILVLSWACGKVGWGMETGQALTSGILAGKWNRGKRWMGHVPPLLAPWELSTAAGGGGEGGGTSPAGSLGGRAGAQSPPSSSFPELLREVSHGVTHSHKQKSSTIYVQNPLHTSSHMISFSLHRTLTAEARAQRGDVTCPRTTASR